jgi:predicted aspartyl protease
MLIPVRKRFPEAHSMGFVNLRVRIANIAERTRFEDLELLADSGALYSVVPAELLDRLGILPTHTEEFELADGRVIERRIGVAHFTVKDRDGVANVIFGEPADSTLLGVVALEQLGLVIDTANGDVKRIHFRLGRLAFRRTADAVAV